MKDPFFFIYPPTNYKEQPGNWASVQLLLAARSSPTPISASKTDRCCLLYNTQRDGVGCRRGRPIAKQQDHISFFFSYTICIVNEFCCTQERHPLYTHILYDVIEFSFSVSLLLSSLKEEGYFLVSFPEFSVLLHRIIKQMERHY